MTRDAEMVPDDYRELLAELERTLAQTRAHGAVNTELLSLYWRIGSAILSRQSAEGGGTALVERLSTDLRAAFPDMKGLSRGNLFYMRAFAAAWDAEAAQSAVGQLPWEHVTVLLDRVEDPTQRDWYAARAVEQGWSRDELMNRIMSQLHSRTDAAPSNFGDQLPADDSELAQHLTRDPYVLDFLRLTEPVSERDLEQAVVAHLQEFLLELGHGFAFVGRQYHFVVDGDDFYIDLLFFNWLQSRFVVFKLAPGQFRPEHAGQLGFCVSWVDQNLRDQTRHVPTIGILLCAGGKTNVVRYALAGTRPPLAVAGYTFASLPTAIRDTPARETLPTVRETSPAVISEVPTSIRDSPAIAPELVHATAATPESTDDHLQFRRNGRADRTASPEGSQAAAYHTHQDIDERLQRLQERLSRPTPDKTGPVLAPVPEPDHRPER